MVNRRINTVYERVGKSVSFLSIKTSKSLTDAYDSCEKDKETSWLRDLFTLKGCISDRSQNRCSVLNWVCKRGTIRQKKLYER